LLKQIYKKTAKIYKKQKEIFLQTSDYQYYYNKNKFTKLYSILHGMQEAVGSNPIFSTLKIKELRPQS